MRKYVLILLSAMFLLSSGYCLAALPAAAIDSEPVISSAADASQNSAQNGPALSNVQKDGNINKEDASVFKKVELSNEADKKRFFLIARDDRFFYYLDRKSARWIFEPNSSRKIIDVWVKLADANKSEAPSDTYSDASSSQSYLLDHYYIRPDSRQIQFLCELEVTGQPSNNIRQNVYSVKNWEDIVPGSVEETVYNGVTATSDSLIKLDVGKEKSDGQARDFLDRVLNISL